MLLDFTETRRSSNGKVEQILAKLGQSGFAPSVTAMADAVRHGAFLLPNEEIEAVILQACADIIDIKSMLIRLLRIKEH